MYEPQNKRKRKAFTAGFKLQVSKYLNRRFFTSTCQMWQLIRSKVPNVGTYFPTYVFLYRPLRRQNLKKTRLGRRLYAQF